jgi:translation initiation factor 4G
VFKKAQTEHLYAGFYSTLCAEIVRMELLMKGLKPNKANISHCNFRKELLNFCKQSFEIFLNADDLGKKKSAEETEEDRLERELRTKHKLFGNIEFVGELFKQQIVTDSVMQSIFDNLLGLNLCDKKSVNDNTIEAAIKLMNKTGSTLEERVAENTKNPEKKLEREKNLSSIFDRLKDLETKDDA